MFGQVFQLAREMLDGNDARAGVRGGG